MTITTPSGYKVTLKDTFTMGDYRKIQAVYMKNLKISAKAEDGSADLSGASVLEAEDVALSLLVTEIDKDAQKITSNFLDEINTWNVEDGEAVYQAVNQLTQTKQSKKN